MPMLQVNLLKGYTPETKKRLMSSLTAVIRGITRAKPEAISVWIREAGNDDYSRGGVSRQPGIAAQDPEVLVKTYLEAMEQRDLASAKSHLADGFVMTFPGSGELTSLEQLVAWARGRYRFVNKTISSTDVAYGMDRIVVVVNGTLSGEWPNGRPFEGVRFIDRFEVENDRLIRQDVWNDLANAGLE
eukprot:TRINITY_DN7693_c0_g1_i1.p2 TRINITY_DN7693_c0_g1~~TRINITY_DN7693_c0_g1_i1.p2  ORF type:complete len:187 (+),score=31.84 TRINITY_DN7693_c0_g1_i1:52-612(+)